MKKLLIIPALLTVALGMASAKEYAVSFAKPVQAGSVKLAAGDYKLKVEGNNAVFVDGKRQSFTAPAKVEKITKKRNVTAVETKQADGVERLDTINLDGADFKLVF